MNHPTWFLYFFESAHIAAVQLLPLTQRSLTMSTLFSFKKKISNDCKIVKKVWTNFARHIENRAFPNQFHLICSFINLKKYNFKFGHDSCTQHCVSRRNVNFKTTYFIQFSAFYNIFWTFIKTVLTQPLGVPQIFLKFSPIINYNLNSIDFERSFYQLYFTAHDFNIMDSMCFAFHHKSRAFGLAYFGKQPRWDTTLYLTNNHMLCTRYLISQINT